MRHETTAGLMSHDVFPSPTLVPLWSDGIPAPPLESAGTKRSLPAVFDGAPMRMPTGMTTVSTANRR